jgi:hypothetical protein
MTSSSSRDTSGLRQLAGLLKQRIMTLTTSSLKMVMKF